MVDQVVGTNAPSWVVPVKFAGARLDAFLRHWLPHLSRRAIEQAGAFAMVVECVPAELAHLPVDYETLQSIGTMMGSGGMVALDETDCMVDIARYFLEFTQNQSCGKCTFCRIGTRRMLGMSEAELEDKIVVGTGRRGPLTPCIRRRVDVNVNLITHR